MPFECLPWQLWERLTNKEEKQYLGKTKLFFFTTHNLILTSKACCPGIRPCTSPAGINVVKTVCGLWQCSVSSHHSPKWAQSGEKDVSYIPINYTTLLLCYRVAIYVHNISFTTCSSVANRTNMTWTMGDFYDLFFVLTGLDFITRMSGSLSSAVVKPSCCSRTFDSHQHFASERNRRLTTVFDVKRAHPRMKYCDLMSRKFYPLAPSWANTHVCVCGK